MNGPESFTPDLLFALGEAPGRRNCFVSAGYNSEGIELAPGAGRALAEWIVEGEPTMDLSHVDIARFHPFQVNKTYLHARAGESLGLHYKMHWPHRQREAARPARTSALHDRWAARNACFGEAMGWERPLWFAPEGMEPACAYSWRWPNWFDHTAEECRAARTGVVVLDQSSFGKHLIQGRDACRELQRLCAGDVDVPPGKLVYTHMLNRRGGIECDITVNRLGEERFLLVSSATTQPRDLAWMERHLAAEAHVAVTDVTGAWAVLSVQGPKSRALLANLTDADLSNDGFPFATSREIDVGHARLIANRLTYVGELGWELFVPTEFAQDVCDRLLAEGEGVGLEPAGYHALEHLRSERAYREYELDLTPEDTPFEAGLGFAVQLDKPHGFIGRDALRRQKEAGPLTKRLVMFRLKDPEPVLFGEEVIQMDGRIAGYVSSGAYGFTLRSFGRHGLHTSSGRCDPGAGRVRELGDRDRVRALSGRSLPAGLLRPRRSARAGMNRSRVAGRPRLALLWGQHPARMRKDLVADHLGVPSPVQESAGTMMQSSGRKTRSIDLPACSRGWPRYCSVAVMRRPPSSSMTRWTTAPR